MAHDKDSPIQAFFDYVFAWEKKNRRPKKRPMSSVAKPKAAKSKTPKPKTNPFYRRRSTYPTRRPRRSDPRY